jgi:CheY-like chemotaxis protein
LEVRKLAHDLNNLLTVIQGNADLARLDIAQDHPAWESVEEVCLACVRARDSVRQILALCHQHGLNLSSDGTPAAGVATAGSGVSLRNLPARQAGPWFRILLIDDDQAYVTLAERSLARNGHQVTGFTQPAQAVATFRENPDRFDLVLCDLQMPGYPGFEVAQELFRIRPGMKVILTSGALNPEETARARQLGVLDILVKPDAFETLAEIIQRHA